MSCLLEIQIPFSWLKVDKDNVVIDFPMNHIAYSLLEQYEVKVIKREKDFESDFLRLESKVNLMLQMLSQMITSNPKIPESQMLQIGTNDISWCEPEAEVGEEYVITLYLNECNRIPIQVLVRITEINTDFCHATLVAQNSDEQSAWERWVFRQHRRNIATTRV